MSTRLLLSLSTPTRTRCPLNKVGPLHVPVSDGDRTNNFPGWSRAILDGIVEAGVQVDLTTRCPSIPTKGHAAELLASFIR